MKKKYEKEEAKNLIGLGKAIITICSKSNRSLERVAYEAGISKSYIYDIAKGNANPSFLIIHRIASALELPIWKLIKSFEKDN